MNTAATSSTSYDPARERQSVRYGKQKGVTIYLPAEELRAAGIDPDGPPPKYRTRGYRRSRKGRSIIVSLYVDGE